MSLPMILITIAFAQPDPHAYHFESTLVEASKVLQSIDDPEFYKNVKITSRDLSHRNFGELSSIQRKLLILWRMETIAEGMQNTQDNWTQLFKRKLIRELSGDFPQLSASEVAKYIEQLRNFYKLIGVKYIQTIKSLEGEFSDERSKRQVRYYLEMIKENYNLQEEIPTN